MNAAAAVYADPQAVDDPEALAGFTRWGADGHGDSSLRLAGGLLATASAWALGHGLWLKIAAYCFG